MQVVKQFLFLPKNDIRRWDIKIALMVLLSIPTFLIYKFFSSDSTTFLLTKIQYYISIRAFIYFLSSKLTLAFLLSIWLISCRRKWWFLICWPLFWYINDFFYIFFYGLGWFKKSLLGFNFYAFFVLPFLYILRKRYQEAYQKANPTEPTYKKTNLLLDPLAILLLVLSVPLTSIYLFFDPSLDPTLKLDFRLSSLLEGRRMFNFVYDFFDRIVAVALLLIWFFESKRWWYFIIGWPILLLSFRWIDVLRYNLAIDLMNPKLWYVFSFSLMIIYPIYRIRGYLSWDIFHDQFNQKKSFFLKITYLLNSMGEYFVVCSCLVFIDLFIPQGVAYPLNILTLAFLTVWFFFSRQWWYFLIALPLIWYVLKVASGELNEGFMILLISLVSLYPIYKMRSYLYKEALEKI